jgi:energy-coupling factor transporter transmembrane protein EcfT
MGMLGCFFIIIVLLLVASYIISLIGYIIEVTVSHGLIGLLSVIGSIIGLVLVVLFIGWLFTPKTPVGLTDKEYEDKYGRPPE